MPHAGRNETPSTSYEYGRSAGQLRLGHWGENDRSMAAATTKAGDLNPGRLGRSRRALRQPPKARPKPLDLPRAGYLQQHRRSCALSGTSCGYSIFFQWRSISGLPAFRTLRGLSSWRKGDER